MPNLNVSLEDVQSCSAEELFSRLVQAGNGGTRVRSTAAPALSTEFVRSRHKTRAHPGSDGAFAEISYPHVDEIDSKIKRKHSDGNIFGYASTKGSDVFPAGFGERSARALAREENTYQMKGTFPSAMLNFSKLKARIEAREGDTRSVERIFARMWGLKEEAAEAIPNLHVDGSEAPRLSAMEDRAYHALSGHPGHDGGYRVDTATLASDALGDHVPLNWPRMRTALKCVALVQIQGDVAMATLVRSVQRGEAAKFTMDLVYGSQPAYCRGQPWETIMDQLLSLTEKDGDQPVVANRDEDLGFALAISYQDVMINQIINTTELRMGSKIQRIGRVVSETSARSLERTIEVMIEHDQDRLLIDIEKEEDYEELDKSHMSAKFHVPRYKLTRSTLAKGIRVRMQTSDNLPDMTTRGAISKVLDLREFRESGIIMPVTIPGALHLAVYIAASNPQSLIAMHQLVHRVPAPPDPPCEKTTIRLRRQELYNRKEVYELGPLVFGASFRMTLELLFGNMATRETYSERTLKEAIWNYLGGRCRNTRKCPIEGSWRDMLIDILDQPESWSLYYWARVTVGKKGHAVSSGIIAAISAGEVVDFLTLIRKNVKERIQYWASYYTSQYRSTTEEIERLHDARKSLEGEGSKPRRYIPPHLRRMVELESEEGDGSSNYVGADRVLFMRLVEMQSKAKFFHSIQVSTRDSRISVGITDGAMRDMMVEFYQARWYSLFHRIEKARRRGKKFRLGVHEFEEHPWGEMLDPLPDTYTGMLYLMENLDDRAWTIPPGYVQEKFRKSITELWSDIRSEIIDITNYIHEVHDGIAEDQEELLAERDKGYVIAATAGSKPIALPAVGYIAPYRMPQKVITVHDGDSSTIIPMAPSTFAVDQDSDQDSQMSDLQDPDELDDMLDLPMKVQQVDDLELERQEYMTLRQIWHKIALPHVTDDKIIIAMGLPADLDLDVPHVDGQYGPVVVVGDVENSMRAWMRKKPLMLQRLGLNSNVVLDDDM